MSGELDAAGTAIEGALLGAAMEPSQGGAGTSETGACVNCGAALSGPYCAACGQKAHVHRTLSAIWHDILHSVLHFDGKMWRTLPMLLFKPGELTRRYVLGERAKFVSPMALFLFSIFLMFAVFSFSGGSAVQNNWQRGAEEEATRLDKEIAATEARLSKPAELKPGEDKELAAKLNELKTDRNGIAFATTGAPIYDEAGVRSSDGGKRWLSYNSKAETGWLWLDQTLDKGAKKMVSNPSLAFYKLQSNGYKFAWLLIPLSLPFVWLVTIGVRGHRFYDHAVFATYSIAFMSLLFLSITLMSRIGLDDSFWGLAFVLIPPIHIYKQLRHAYGLSRGSAMLRAGLLLLFIVIVVSLFAMTLLFLGLLG